MSISEYDFERFQEYYENRMNDVRKHGRKNDNGCLGGTICWNCANAVPNSEGTTGCEWSLNLQPVPGWEAIEKIIPTSYRDAYGKLHHRKLKSYRVLQCHRFKEG